MVVTDVPQGRSLRAMATRARFACIAALGAFAVSAAAAQPASACSCAAQPITAETFRKSDGAVIGKLRDRAPVNEQEVELRYLVEEVFRGRRLIEPGSRLRVRTAAQGSACGIETPKGGRDGLFLDRRIGQWDGNLCATTSPKRMRRAAERTGFARTSGCGS